MSSDSSKPRNGGEAMKCFQVDEANWYAGNTPEEAVAAYIADAGEEVREYVEEFGEPREITNMDLHVADDDEPKGYKLGEIMAKMGKPGFVATSEY
jgi:hypothetical protein